MTHELTGAINNVLKEYKIENTLI